MPSPLCRPTPALVLALGLLLSASDARAHSGAMALGPYDHDFRAQLQVGVHGALALPAAGFGVAEARMAASIMSLGLAAELGYERALERHGTAFRELHCGYFVLAVEFRPLALADDGELFRWFDPFVAVGGRIGLVQGLAVPVRGALVLELGFDARMSRTEPEAVLTVRYRMEPARHPERVDWHFLMAGVSLRWTDD
jgi:hypothetical protein